MVDGVGHQSIWHGYRDRVLPLHQPTAINGDVAADHRAIVEMAGAEAVTTIVVGLPLSLSGASGPAAVAAEAEIQELRSLVGADVEVVAHDERLTTVTAERALDEARVDRRTRKKVVDKVAAAVMLQSWLESHVSAR